MDYKQIFLKMKQVFQEDIETKDDIIDETIDNQDVKIEFVSDNLSDGTPVFYETTIEAGVVVYTDEAMTTPLMDGEYELEDGTIITIIDGIVSEVWLPITEEDLEVQEEEVPIEQSDNIKEQILDLINKLSVQVKDIQEDNKQFKEKLSKMETDIKVIGDEPSTDKKFSTQPFIEKTLTEKRMDTLDILRKMSRVKK